MITLHDLSFLLFSLLSILAFLLLFVLHLTDKPTLVMPDHLQEYKTPVRYIGAALAFLILIAVVSCLHLLLFPYGYTRTPGTFQQLLDVGLIFFFSTRIPIVQKAITSNLSDYPRLLSVIEKVFILATVVLTFKLLL